MDVRIFTEPQAGASYDAQLGAARAAAAAGFSAYFRSDHYQAMGPAAPDPSAGLPGPTDTWITRAGLTRETSRIRLGTLMTAGTFRYPGPLAISVAQVDVMSAGRVELGLGAGWYETEHLSYGIPFPRLLPSGSIASRNNLRSSKDCGRRRPASPTALAASTINCTTVRHCPSLPNSRIRHSSLVAGAW